MSKPYLTLRDFVRRKTGTFSARDVLGEYLEYRNAVRLDVVRRQLELMADSGELMRHKCGLNVFYSVKASRRSLVQEFDALIMPVRRRNSTAPYVSGWGRQIAWVPFNLNETSS